MADIDFDYIRITASSCKVDFNQARRLAEEVILGMVRSPRLIAWIDSKKDKTGEATEPKEYPDALLSQDGGVRVDINDNEYSFIFTETDSSEMT